MTFYYIEDENVLEGNRIGKYTEVDGETVRIDVGAILEEGRGVDKLREIQQAIDDAIEST